MAKRKSTKRFTTHTCKTKDRVTRTPLKTEGGGGGREAQSVSLLVLHLKSILFLRTWMSTFIFPVIYHSPGISVLALTWFISHVFMNTRTIKFAYTTLVMFI